MLDGQSSWRSHLAQNLFLILLSLVFLPFDTFVLLASYALQILIPHGAKRRQIRRSPGFRPRTVLVTGVGMSKGLALARMFYEAGHNVIGADFEPQGVPVCGRFSKALKKFYRLPKPDQVIGPTYYIEGLLQVVKREHVDLWVSCSGVASAVEDGQAKEVIERRSDCKAIQFDVQTTATLHEKHSFIQRTMALGLPAPETYDVCSRDAVHKVLQGARKKQYIMKSVGVDDASRGNMTLLPRRTVSETYSHISKIAISKEKPWVLQQYIHGEEYCTHALVIKGDVKAFVACPSLELLMHYEALPSNSALSQAMFKFTKEFVHRSGEDMTGHLSFDFLIEETSTEKGLTKTLYPIECNPRAHTAVILFADSGISLTAKYMEAISPATNGIANGHAGTIVTPSKPRKYYWIGHDLATLVLYPAFLVLMMRMNISSFIAQCFTFLQHVISWKDGTYELWDPLPWWWLYHIYWPGQFLSSILQRRKWSRVNVSTTKMFVC